MTDILAIGAHPDDLELFAGGTLAGLHRRGARVHLLHLSRGELGSRGTPELRATEAAAAAQCLGAASLEILDLPDGALADDGASRAAVVARIRQHRPQLLIAPLASDAHPDHAAAGALAKSAWYLAGVHKFARGSAAAFRPPHIWYYPAHELVLPSITIRVAQEDFEAKIRAIRCYASQFSPPGQGELRTRIAEPDFLPGIDARLRHYGSLAGAGYAEPFVLTNPVHVSNPLAFLE